MSYHHLDVCAVVLGDTERVLGGSDSLPCCGVVVLAHGLGLAVASSYRLIDDLKHTHVAIFRVVGIVDELGHPLEEFVGTFVLEIEVEARCRGVLYSFVSMTDS